MKFYIKQKVFSLKDQFSVMDEQQNEVFQVQGKMFSFANKLDLKTRDDQVVLHAKKQVFSFMPKYFILTPQDEQIALVQRKFGFRPKFVVQALGREFTVEGTFFGHAFGVFDGDQEVASISKKVISWGDTYEIDIRYEQNIPLFLFIVIIIDQVIHEQKRRNYN